MRDKGHLPVLDGLRGLAIALVLLDHVTLYTPWASDWPPLLVQIGLFGWAGVQLFFILSGFLIFLPYAGALVRRTPWPDPFAFYRRRARRILPVYFAFLIAIGLPLALAGHLHATRLPAAIETALLLHNMDTAAADLVSRLNAPLWTLAVEWQFYLMLPWLARGIARLGAGSPARLWRPLALLVSLGVGTRALATLLHYAGGQAQPQDAPGALGFLVRLLFGVQGRYLEEFALGMGLAVVYVAVIEPGRIAVQWRRRVVGACLLAAGAGLPLCHLWARAAGLYDLSGANWPRLSLAGWTWALAGQWAVAACFCLLMAAALLSRGLLSWGLLARALAVAPLRWLGTISYSVYIWHLWVFRLVAPGWPLLPAVILLGAASYYVIERPFLATRRNMVGGLVIGRRMGEVRAAVTTSRAG
jgi:peptidoglycan/LPS O-acetylase OafA/YrhL